MKSYINTNNIKTKKPLSTLFKSFLIHYGDYSKPDPYESLLNNTYGVEYLCEQSQKQADFEDFLEDCLFNIQNDYAGIYIVDGLTGEIIFEIPFTPENLEKPFWKILPFELSEVQYEIFTITK